MKAFLAALVAIAAISIGADLALKRAGFSSAAMFSGQDVRLDGGEISRPGASSPQSY